MSALTQARRKADRTRNEWLVSIDAGVVTVPDLLRAATTESGRALRKLGLRQVLESQPGFSRAQAERVLDHTRTLLGAEPDLRLTVAWLIDPRTGGRRLQAWADALQQRDLPWTGFPYAPKPNGRGVHA